MSARPGLVGSHVIVLTCLIVVLPCLTCAAENATDALTAMLATANAAYDRGEYQAALDTYLQVLQQGGANGAVYYNCANCYFQLQQLGRAILYYEKAARLLPRDADIKANLELARTMTQDKLDEPEVGRLTSVITYLYHRLNLRELLLLTLGFYCGATIAFMLAIILYSSPKRRVFVWIGVVLMVPTLIIGASLLARLYNGKYHPQAIVIEEEINVRSGPGADFTTLFTLHEGAKVFIRGERAGWNQILLSNGLAGMAPQTAFMQI